jgi:hypothetical protein
MLDNGNIIKIVTYIHIRGVMLYLKRALNLKLRESMCK